EDRRTAYPTCPVLLVAPGREPSDAAALWEHAAEDRGAPGAGWIKRAPSGAKFDDDAGRRKKCVRHSRTRCISGRGVPIRCENGTPRVAGNTVDQNRLKPCRGRPFGPSWNRRVKGNPSLATPRYRENTKSWLLGLTQNVHFL